MMQEGPLLSITLARSHRSHPLVAHAAWCEARDRILALAATGAATVALLGDAGTGKTLLLRELMPALRQLGREVTLVRQGDLPFEFAAGSAVLVDEAARMDEDRLAELADQRTGLLVLAGLPSFSKRLKACGCFPSVVPLRRLEEQELREFTREWLTRSGDGEATVTDGAIERVIVRSGGIARLATQMLGAALAITDGPVGSDDVDEVADLSLCGLGTGPVVSRALERVAGPRPEVLAPATRRTWRVRPFRLAGGAAIAATILLMPASRPGVWRETTFTAAAVPMPLTQVEAPATELAAGTEPASAIVPPAPVAETVKPDQADVAAPLALASDARPVGKLADAAAPAVIGAPAPQSASIAQPVLAYSPPVVQDWPPADGFHPRLAGGSGLVLVAGPSDTLPQLYAKVYRGVQPPPYAEVVAANQLQVRPGAILVFPAPAEGWNRR